jgi:hypothetical protein
VTRKRAEFFDLFLWSKHSLTKLKLTFRSRRYGANTAEKEECEEQLLTEYATLLGFYLASMAVLTGIAADQNRLPRKFSLLDLALLGIATHKVSRIVGASVGLGGAALSNQGPRELANALDQICFARKYLDLPYDRAADDSCVCKTPHSADLFRT